MMGIRFSPSVAVALLLCARITLAEAPVTPDTAPSQRAGPSSADAIQRAREHFLRGVALARQGLWQEARAEFEASAELRPHAMTFFNIAYCERALGRYTRALLAFDRALARSSSSRPAELPKHVSEGIEDYIRELRAQLVTVTIRTTERDLRLLVDGVPPEQPGASEIRLDPGTHRLEWLRNGRVVKRLVRHFEPAEHAHLTIEVERPSAARPARPLTWPSSPGVKVRADRSATRSPVGPIVLGVSCAAVLAGSVLGFVAWRKKSTLDDDCPDGRCAAEHHAALSSARTYADAATVTLTVGALGLATGAVLSWPFSDTF